MAFQFGTLLEYQVSHTLGSEDRRGGFNHKQVSRFQARDDGARGRLHVCDVRTVVLLERSGYHHEESIGSFRFRHGPQMPALHSFLDNFVQVRFHNVHLSLVDSFHNRRIHIHSHHLVTVMGSDCRRRQTDVSQA